VLDGYNAEYKVVELNEVSGGYALRAELAELTGRTSVPALYVGGQFLGGCNDGGLGGVMTLDRNGKLQPLLAEAGALR
jgi:glutaredoxin 3